jgi:hypothetical protein
LPPSPAHDRDEPRGGQLGDGEQIDLATVGFAHRDATHATAPSAEIDPRLDEAHFVVVADERCFSERRLGEHRERTPLVGHQLQTRVAKVRHRLRERARAIEREQHALAVANHATKQHADRREPLGERAVRCDVDAEERPTVLIVHVIVSDSRANALVLHAPAATDDALAGVRPQVIVDVVDAAVVVACRRAQVHDEHRDVKPRGAELVGEVRHHLTHAPWRRTRLGPQQHG